MYPTPLTSVMILGGDSADFQWLRQRWDELGRPEQVLEWVQGMDDGLARLARDSRVLVFIWLKMGVDRAAEFMRQADARGGEQEFVIVSEKPDRDLEESLRRAGAVDCVSRQDLSAALLIRILRMAAERHASEGERRESEERFRLAANAVPVPLRVVNNDGRGIFFNQRWMEFRGRSFLQECGHGWHEGIHPDDKLQALGLMANALHQRTPFEIEYRLQRADGSYRWVRDSGRPRFLPRGDFAGMVSVAVDVSDKRSALRERSEEGKEAADAARMNGLLLANLSREIRAPMNGIIGLAGLFLDTELSDEQRELAESMQKNAEIVLGVLNDILDFSRAGSSRPTIEAVGFDLRSLVEDTISLMSERAGDKGLDLACEIPGGISTHLRGDPNRLRQVLINLVGNAIKFTDKGEVLVRISLLEETETALVFRVAVTDTGIGITPEAQRLLFRPHDQEASSWTLDGSSGLAVSRHLVETMGGRIGVDSEPQKGSTFWFELSLPRLVEDLSAIREASFPQGINALVVDGRKTSRRVVVGQLAQLNIHAEAVSSTNEAVEVLKMRAAERSPFALVLVDRRVADDGGRILASAIRSDSRLSDVALIMMTTANRLNEIGELKRLGFDGFLLQPARQGQLRKILVQALSDRDWRELRPRPRVAEPRAPVFEPRTGKCRVLVIEDNLVNQKVAQRHIEKMGHHVDVAEHGEVALDMLALQRYDLIFMDCQMPVMDGYETTRRIRAGRVPNLDPAIPIVALTAYATDADRQKCFAAGMDDFLAKPIRFEELQAAVERRVIKRAGDLGGGDSQTSDNLPVLDRVQFDHLCQLQDEHDRHFVKEMIELFLVETPRRLGEMRTHLANAEFRTLAHSAHAVKGAAANFGAIALKASCQCLEGYAMANRSAEAATVLDQLDQEMIPLTLALQKLKETFPP